jgi:hypothetical protein
MVSNTQIRAKAPELPGTGGVWFSVVLLALAALLFIVRGVRPGRVSGGIGQAYTAPVEFEATANANSSAGGEGR